MTQKVFHNYPLDRDGRDVGILCIIETGKTYQITRRQLIGNCLYVDYIGPNKFYKKSRYHRDDIWDLIQEFCWQKEMTPLDWENKTLTHLPRVNPRGESIGYSY